MTTTEVAFFVCGLVWVTVAVEPLTAVTIPEAAPKLVAPLGNFPPLGGRRPEPPSGKLAPDGGPPLGLPPVLGPPPNPPKPVEQAPDVGCEMETEVAVTGSPRARVPDFELDVGLPKAEMHDPTLTSETVAATVWSNVVLVLYVTVVCPEVEFCTSNDVPLMEAMVPEAPGI